MKFGDWVLVPDNDRTKFHVARVASSSAYDAAAPDWDGKTFRRSPARASLARW